MSGNQSPSATGNVKARKAIPSRGQSNPDERTTYPMLAPRWTLRAKARQQLSPVTANDSMTSHPSKKSDQPPIKLHKTMGKGQALGSVAGPFSAQTWAVQVSSLVPTKSVLLNRNSHVGSPALIDPTIPPLSSGSKSSPVPMAAGSPSTPSAPFSTSAKSLTQHPPLSRQPRNRAAPRSFRSLDQVDGQLPVRLPRPRARRIGCCTCSHSRRTATHGT